MSAIANFFSGLLGSNKPTTTANDAKNTPNVVPANATTYNGPMLGGKRRKATRKSRKATRKSRKANRKSTSRKNTRRSRK
jgi:hypothetical protein